MYEQDMVKEILERCLDRGYCILDEQMVNSMQRCMYVIIDRLHSQYDNSSFKIANYVVLVLHKILTAKDKSEIEHYKRHLNLTDEQFAAILELYSRSSEDDEYRKALIRIHSTFCGRCYYLAGSNRAYWKQQLKRAQTNPTTTRDLEEIQRKLDKANDDLRRVDDFVEKHNVEEIKSGSILRMDW